VEVVGLTLTPRTLGARILLTTAQLGQHIHFLSHRRSKAMLL
jgi:hypothetical protein